MDKEEIVCIDDPAPPIRYTDPDANTWRIFLDGVEIYDATEVRVLEGIVWRKTFTRAHNRTGGERLDEKGRKNYEYRGAVRAERKGENNAKGCKGDQVH